MLKITQSPHERPCAPRHRWGGGMMRELRRVPSRTAPSFAIAAWLCRLVPLVVICTRMAGGASVSKAWRSMRYLASGVDAGAVTGAGDPGASDFKAFVLGLDVHKGGPPNGAAAVFAVGEDHGEGDDAGDRHDLLHLLFESSYGPFHRALRAMTEEFGVGRGEEVVGVAFFERLEADGGGEDRVVEGNGRDPRMGRGSGGHGSENSQRDRCAVPPDKTAARFCRE